LAALAALACGCTKQDKERLAVVGSRLSAKADGLTSASRAKLTMGWQALRTNWEELSLDARVTARLRWDKTLADAPIRIETNGTVVRLQGAVRDAAQRRRAVELASSTVGVERVTEEWDP
jgi:osmotically-inducible protein OsmY